MYNKVADAEQNGRAYERWLVPKLSKTTTRAYGAFDIWYCMVKCVWKVIWHLLALLGARQGYIETGSPKSMGYILYSSSFDESQYL